MGWLAGFHPNFRELFLIISATPKYAGGYLHKYLVILLGLSTQSFSLAHTSLLPPIILHFTGPCNRSQGHSRFVALNSRDALRRSFRLLNNIFRVATIGGTLIRRAVVFLKETKFINYRSLQIARDPAPSSSDPLRYK